MDCLRVFIINDNIEKSGGNMKKLMDHVKKLPWGWIVTALLAAIVAFVFVKIYAHTVRIRKKPAQSRYPHDNAVSREGHACHIEQRSPEKDWERQGRLF